MIYLLLLLSTTFNFNVNYAPQPDKIAHLEMGAIAGSVGYLYVDWTNDNASTSGKVAFGITMATILGFAKEDRDLYYGGEANGADWLYTIAGGIVGAIITHKIINREPDFEQKTNRAIRRYNDSKR